MNQEILYNVGGSLVFDPPQPGRPSSATVEILDPSGTTHVTSGAVDTVDPVNTTLNATLSAGSANIVLTSVSNVNVGRRYVISNAKGQHEWVRTTTVDASTKIVQLSSAPSFIYPGGSPFVGNRITHAVSAANADTLDEGYSAAWAYVIDGVTYRAITYYDVVRTRWTDIVVTPWQFRSVAGDMGMSDLESLEQSGLDFADEIAEATRRVREEVTARGYRPALFRSYDNFIEPICQRVLLTFAERGESVPAPWQDQVMDWIELRREVYAEALTTALNSSNYDEDESGGISDTERKARLGSVRVTL